MEHRLSNGNVIILDKDQVFPDPRADAIKKLEAFRDAVSQQTEEGAMKKGLADYTDEELYAEMDKIGIGIARLGRWRDQYTDHTREYLKARRKQVTAELRRRGLRVAKPGSRKTLPTAAHLAVRGRELKEVAA